MSGPYPTIGRLATSGRLSTQRWSRTWPEEVSSGEPSVFSLAPAAWTTFGLVAGGAAREAPAMTSKSTSGAASVAQRRRGGAFTNNTITTPIPAPIQADRLKVMTRPSASTIKTFAASHRPDRERAESTSHAAIGSSMARKAPRAFGLPKVP